MGLLDDEIGAARRKRTVFQIHGTPVQQQTCLICIKENRRKLIIGIIHDELTLWRFEQRLGQRAGRKVRVEDNESQSRGMKKQHHHYGEAEYRPLSRPSPCSE